MLASRPRVRVNQVGYLTDGPKRAVLITDATAPIRFEVRTGAGVTALVGESAPWPMCPDPSSGMRVHRIEFRAVTEPGDGYRVVADGAASRPFTIGSDPYGTAGGRRVEVLHAATLWRRHRGHRRTCVRTTGRTRRGATEPR